jgi:hypothetical protein
MGTQERPVSAAVSRPTNFSIHRKPEACSDIGGNISGSVDGGRAGTIDLRKPLMPDADTVCTVEATDGQITGRVVRRTCLFCETVQRTSRKWWI